MYHKYYHITDILTSNYDILSTNYYLQWYQLANVCLRWKTKNDLLIVKDKSFENFSKIENVCLENFHKSNNSKTM